MTESEKLGSNAQATPGYNTAIPSKIMTPDTVGFLQDLAHRQVRAGLG
jgi:hypothetical protein